MSSIISSDVGISVPESTLVISEIAQIFAKGALRLHQLGELPFGPNGLSLETALETFRHELEQSGEMRLNVTRV